MTAILDELKELLEVDVSETIFDTQLLLYANGGIGYLINNGIPLTRIDEETDYDSWELRELHDYDVILSWLHLYCLQRFDRTLMTTAYKTTTNWIDEEMTNLLYQLKIRYDRSDVREIE